MSKVRDEKVAYISPGGSSWRVEIRDGTMLSDGMFTVRRRYYHDELEDACEQAERFEKVGRVSRIGGRV